MGQLFKRVIFQVKFKRLHNIWEEKMKIVLWVKKKPLEFFFLPKMKTNFLLSETSNHNWKNIFESSFKHCKICVYFKLKKNCFETMLCFHIKVYTNNYILRGLTTKKFMKRAISSCKLIKLTIKSVVLPDRVWKDDLLTCVG